MPQSKAKRPKAGSDEDDSMQVDRAKVQDSEDDGPVRPKGKKKNNKFRTSYVLLPLPSSLHLQKLIQSWFVRCSEFIEDSDADPDEEAPAKETDEE